MSFAFATVPRIMCRAGAISALGQEARALGIRRAFVVTDPGLARAGLAEHALAALEQAGISVVLYDRARADPPIASIADALEEARAARPDGVIGLGGGSSMDTAKLVALLAGKTVPLRQAISAIQPEWRRLPLIQVPTTAGTGSEASPIAIVTAEDDEKLGVVALQLLADVALLDPELTLGLPPDVTAMTGIDAIVHATEAYTSAVRKNLLSDALALKAIALLFGHIRRAVKDGKDLDARSAMLEGSLLAGMAFSNAPVGAVHALAYPLGGQFGIPHGLTNALVLLPVLDFNLAAAREAYAELGGAIGTPADAAAFRDAVAALLADMPIAQSMGELGIKRSHLPTLADDAMKVTRLLVNNPRPVTREDALAIYAQAL